MVSLPPYGIDEDRDGMLASAVGTAMLVVVPDAMVSLAPYGIDEDRDGMLASAVGAVMLVVVMSYRVSLLEPVAWVACELVPLLYPWLPCRLPVAAAETVPTRPSKVRPRTIFPC